MSESSDNNIISILKIGDSNNYLYKSDVYNIPKEDDTNWSWLIKFAYSFNDYDEPIQNIEENENEDENVDENVDENEEQRRMTQLKKELRKELQEKKKSEQIQSKKKKSEKKQRVNIMGQPEYKILTDEEYIIKQIFQNLQMYFPVIAQIKPAKQKYKEELLNAFSELDLNKDGKISKEEFIKVYNKRNPEQKLNFNNDKKKINKLFQSVGDTNNDGVIDKVEFIIYMIREDEAAAKKKKRRE